MKSIASNPIRLSLCLCLMLALLLPLTSALALEDDASVGYAEIIVCGSSDCKPIEMYSNGEYVGAMPELFKAISEQTGLRFSYLANSLEDAYELGKSGQYDILSAVSADEMTLRANSLIPGPVCFSYNGVDYRIAYTQRVPEEYIALINSSIERLPEEARTLSALKAADRLYLARIPLWLIGLVIILVAACIAIAALSLLRKSKHNSSIQTDELTALQNKDGLIATLISLKGRHQLPLYMLAYIALDLEKLRLIFGQAETDELMQQTANALKEYLKPRWFAARLDEFGFAVAFPASGNEEARALLEPILSELQKLLSVNRGSLKCGINTGVCRVDISSTELNKSIDTARLVASCAKESSESLLFYSPKLISKATFDYRTARDILASINLDAFEIFALPQVDPCSMEIKSAQALVRWRHPERGLLLPGSFMPAIEDTDKLKELDTHVFSEVCAWVHSRIEKKLEPRIISCNLSAASLKDPSLHESLRQYLELYQIPPSSIALELNPDLLNDGDAVADNIAKLSSYGLLIAIDNFGSENTSFLSLAKNKVYQVVLSRELLPERNLDKETIERYVLLLNDVVSLCKRLGLYVSVSGVEDELDHELVKTLGCNLAEGYYYYHPMPKEEFDKL